MTTTGHSVTGGPEMRLATYGTLAPGRPSHGQLSDFRRVFPPFVISAEEEASIGAGVDEADSLVNEVNGHTTPPDSG